MPASCYILYSSLLNRYYIGATQKEIKFRIDKHNFRSYGNHRFTATTDDWELFLSIEVEDYSHAIRIERKIKSMKSKVYIQNLKNYPEMRTRLVEETSI